ncbi:hypothetical protein EMGBS8_09900 [Verrucomicrobiota bacterium]|nr:hypothetical protein EMGBS8_09900 [Verrucomicrobiota bacterium]
MVAVLTPLDTAKVVPAASVTVAGRAMAPTAKVPPLTVRLPVKLRPHPHQNGPPQVRGITRPRDSLGIREVVAAVDNKQSPRVDDNRTGQIAFGSARTDLQGSGEDACATRQENVRRNDRCA